jgi:hypothetical protein
MRIVRDEEGGGFALDKDVKTALVVYVVICLE